MDITGSIPRTLDGVGKLPEIVVTVCDQAHEELTPGDTWLHWSVPDPVTNGTRAAFDATVAELRERIGVLIGDSKAAT